jgi:hypothetical protein
LCLASGASLAGSLNYCHGQSQPTAAAQDRMMQVAAIVKEELVRSGHRLALVARSGLALQHLKQRYSHAGVSLQASANAPWSVRQLYYACDEQRPRIFDQGLAGFVLGANDPAEGYLSLVLLPSAEADALESAALDDRQVLQLLGGTYSANAYAFALTYQNCNQWLAELLALAWGPIPAGSDTLRRQAQQWLQAEGYQPSVLQLRWQPLVWVAAILPWLHNDDHPPEDLSAAQFRVSMPQSIESFVRTRLPEARRIELCYSEDQVVVRRGWKPIAAGCVPEEGDEVTTLSADNPMP